MSEWLWMGNLSGQGSCNAFRDTKTDCPNPLPWGLREAELPFPAGLIGKLYFQAPFRHMLQSQRRGRQYRHI